ncbi:hypothetical protein D3C78_1217580 [compost metagenome]
MRNDWLESANQFVLALGSGIETLETVGNGIVHALVETGLEMQAIELCQASPVTAIKTVAPHQTERHRHRP